MENVVLWLNALFFKNISMETSEKDFRGQKNYIFTPVTLSFSNPPNLQPEL